MYGVQGFNWVRVLFDSVLFILVLKPRYSGINRLLAWLMMPWPLPFQDINSHTIWYNGYSINNALSSMTLNFNDRYHPLGYENIIWNASTHSCFLSKVALEYLIYSRTPLYLIASILHKWRSSEIGLFFSLSLDCRKIPFFHSDQTLSHH